MLFDLQGKRRRVVQAVYLLLAVLLGGGLVFFGIGGDVQGGLFDAFSERGGDGNSNSAIEKRVKSNEKRVKANPNDEAARKELVRGYYQLATAQAPGSEGGFGKEAQDELRAAAANWEAYLRLEPEKPDASLARTALQLYDPKVLNKPREAKEAAQLVARVENNSDAYLNLVQYATLAGDTRTADLAGQKAVDLAPKKDKKAVKRTAEQLKKPQPGAGGQAPQQPGAPPQGQAPAQPQAPPSQGQAPGQPQAPPPQGPAQPQGPPQPQP